MRGRWLGAIIVGMLVLSSAITPVRTAASGAPGCPAAFGCDLVKNGGFEDEPGSPDIDHVVKPSSWQTVGQASVLRYGGLDGLPVASDTDATVWRSLGDNFLAGGPGNATNRDAKVWQKIDLRRAAKRIDQGDVAFALSAVLGGQAGNPDFARVWVHFNDEREQPMTNPVGIEPVLLKDREGRTLLSRRACFGDVPPLARYALVSIKLYALTGRNNHAYVDDVEFTLLRATQLEGAEQCVTSGRERDASYIGAARQIDSRSADCLNDEYEILAGLIGVSVLLIMLCWLAGRPRITAKSVSVERCTRLGIAAAAACLSAFSAWAILHWQPVPNYTLCGFDDPWWTGRLAFFCTFAAVNVVGAMIVFVPSKANPWNTYALRLCVFTAAAIGALVLLIATRPTSDALNLMNLVVVLLLIVLFVCLCLPEDIRNRPWVQRPVVSLLLLVLVLPSLAALLNLNRINAERIKAMTPHYFAGEPVHIGGVLFHAPTAMDFGESAAVEFSLYLDGSSGEPTNSCIRPHFSAPGFTITPSSADSMALRPGPILWSWIVKPKQDGRQPIFINILYSPRCKHSDEQGGQPGAGFVTVFSQRDSIWVTRQWFSVENFGSPVSLISLIAVVLALTVAVLELRKHSKNEAAATSHREGKSMDSSEAQREPKLPG